MLSSTLPYTTVYITLYVVYYTPGVYHAGDEIFQSQNNNTLYHRGTLYTTPPAVSCLIITTTPPRYHLGDTVT